MGGQVTGGLLSLFLELRLYEMFIIIIITIVIKCSGARVGWCGDRWALMQRFVFSAMVLSWRS